jgi:hypothetical protein
MSRDGLLPYKHRVVAHYAFILFVNLLDSNYRRRRHASAAPVLLLLFHSTLTHKTPDPDGTISIDKTIVAYMYVCMYVCMYVIVFITTATRNNPAFYWHDIWPLGSTTHTTPTSTW